MNFPNVPDFPRGEFPRMDRIPRVEMRPPGAPDQMFFPGFGSGRRIGANVTTLTKQLSEHFGVASGVMVDEVRADSPAAKAGLKAGDIIVEIDGKEVKAEADLLRAIQGKKEGDVTLTIVRDRNRQTIRVTPEEVKGGFDGQHFEFPRINDGGFAPASMRFSLPMSGFRFPTSIWCL